MAQFIYQMQKVRKAVGDKVILDDVTGIRDVIVRYEELNEKMSAPDADFEKILEEQAPLLDRIEAAGAWEIDSKIEPAMDALRCPPPDEPVVHLSGGERRRVALCKLL